MKHPIGEVSGPGREPLEEDRVKSMQKVVAHECFARHVAKAARNGLITVCQSCRGRKARQCLSS